MQLRSVFLGTIFAATLVASACGSSSGPGPEATQTGITPVDSFLMTLASGNVDAIAIEASMRVEECKLEPEPLFADSNPVICEPGEPAGTPVEVFAMDRGSYLAHGIRRDRLEERVQDLIGDTVEEILEVSGPEGLYAIVFGLPDSDEASPRTVAFLTSEGNLDALGGTTRSQICSSLAASSGRACRPLSETRGAILESRNHAARRPPAYAPQWMRLPLCRSLRQSPCASPKP